MPTLAKKPAAKITPKKAAPKPVESPAVNGRPILYPDITVKLCQGDDALTAEQAKGILGWIDENVSEPDCYDMDGNKVRLANNIGNRPFDKSLAQLWMMEHLHRRWKLNGESCIIGRTGVTLSFQHRGVGLVWAVQEWKKNPERWPQWETEPTMECLLVFGIDESDSTVNTIDTGKPRSLADVIYRSELFETMERQEKLKASKMSEKALNELFERVVADVDAHSGKRSHSASMDFIARHTRILSCVKHILVENSQNKIGGHYLPAGYASAFLFLMGCCATDPAEYRKEGIDPCDDFLDWSMWDKAQEFWVELANGHKKFYELTKKISSMQHDGARVPPDVQRALIVKAWECYRTDKIITEKALELKFKQQDDVQILIEHPLLGGIDMGRGRDSLLVDADDETTAPTPAEIEATKAQIDGENLAKKNGKKPGPKNPKKALAVVGQQVWVEEDGGHYMGFVTEIYKGQAGMVAKVKSVSGTGKAKKERIDEAPLASCLTENPNA